MDHVPGRQAEHPRVLFLGEDSEPKPEAVAHPKPPMDPIDMLGAARVAAAEEASRAMAASAVAPVSVPATSAKPALKRPREKSNNEDGRPSPMPSHGEIYVSRHRPTMPRGTSSPVGVDEVVDEDVGEDVGEDVDEALTAAAPAPKVTLAAAPAVAPAVVANTGGKERPREVDSNTSTRKTHQEPELKPDDLAQEAEPAKKQVGSWDQFQGNWAQFQAAKKAEREAEREAERVKKRAKNEAERVKKRAKNEAERVKKRAKNEAEREAERVKKGAEKGAKKGPKRAKLKLASIPKPPLDVVRQVGTHFHHNPSVRPAVAVASTVPISARARQQRRFHRCATVRRREVRATRCSVDNSRSTHSRPFTNRNQSR